MKIAIIGAGIGGLTTALAFEKLGIDYHLFEKTPEIKPVGAGIWLAPNALHVYDWLGMYTALQEHGNSIDRITIGTQAIAPLSDMWQQPVQDRFGYTTISIHRAALLNILLDKIPEHKITLGKSFLRFESTKKDKVQVIFEDQSSYEFDLLLGADGIHSKVRKQLFPQSSIRYSGQTCWRGVANYDLNSDFKHRGVELWGQQLRFGFTKITAHKVYWFAVARSPKNQQDLPNTTKEKLHTAFADFHPLVGELLETTDSNNIMRNDISDLVPLKKWHQNRICLIGDAAHAATPNMGQGGAQAIEDAYYLARLLQKGFTTDSFDQFQAQRAKKVALVLNQSWSTGKMAHWKYGTALRNALIKNIPEKLVLKKIMQLYSLKN